MHKIGQSFKSSVNSYNRLLDNILYRYKNIDVLINNAGVYKTNAPINKDNLDVRFVVNTIAPFLITRRLLPIINTSGRIINLASAAQASVNFDLLVGKSHSDDAFSIYAQSKLAILMWSCQEARVIGSEGPVIIPVNPGSLLGSKMVKEGFGIEGKDLNIGADILIRLAFDEEFKSASGLYYDNDSVELTQPHPDALDVEKCQALITTMNDIFKQLGIA